MLSRKGHIKKEISFEKKTAKYLLKNKCCDLLNTGHYEQIAFL